MKLDDLFERHYRTIPAYHAAKELFEPVMDPEATPRVSRIKGDTALQDFNEFMKEHGFTNLGSGAFASVYEKPGYPWVFKLFHNDVAYLAWLNYVVAHQSNEHVPKIKGKPFRINDKVFAVRMEKLDRMSDNWYDNELLSNIAYGGISRDAKTAFKALGHPDLIPVMDAIYAMSHDTTKDWRVDTHGGNIMMRGNVPVITDPLVDRTVFE